MTPQQRRQKEAAEPRLAYTVEEIDQLRARLSETRQVLQHLRKEARRVADEIGKRGLVDLADDLRLAAKV